MNGNLLVLLRSISVGFKAVYELENGDLYSILASRPPNSEVRTVESRLQFELYGEYPLSDSNQGDWDRLVKHSFKLK